MMDVLRDGSWEADASCKGAPMDDFFREKSDVPATTKKLCAECPVRRQCLEAAMQEEKGAKKRYGYRGGKSAQERKNLYVSRQRMARLAAKLADRTDRVPDSESMYR